MKEKQILENWLQSKTSGGFYKLEESFLVEYEFCGRFGHPSSYAYVSFECNPSENLCFISDALGTLNLSAHYTAKLEQAICIAVVDGLMNNSIYTYRGCALNLNEVKWDNVGSSEAAFYKATKEAIKKLVDEGKWKYFYTQP